ncbi:hypothetical protein [Hymenobacter lucidus]|uniref:Uncharacterized protein n=1 Tax=Hymenobacter lucidus TaxID=2880930 RepID=A0ABS8AQI7_9BACT|nr:hypothetical protein [Hymenobacter lucidus]MCB2408470.1 hypothetical protein [Hymenobacter lucidus]
MQHSKHSSISQASLLTSQSIEEFDQFLRNHFQTITYTGKLVEGTSIDFLFKENVLSYSNNNRRNLESIEIKCYGEFADREWDKYLSISFKDEMSLIKPKTISYHLSYESREWGFKFEDDLLSEIKIFKPIYNILTYADFIGGFLLLLPAILVLFLVLDGAFRLMGRRPVFASGNANNTSNDLSSISIVFLIITIVIVLGYVLNKIRDYLFPRLYIATGRQSKEYEKKMWIAGILLGTIVLGLAIEFLSSILFK